jgi:cytochrome c biogenesis protein CcdA
MGSQLLQGGSILAAFFAGAVALFAPCCIVFLAPSYLAAAVKNRRWRLLPLTFVFTAGLALVLIPITLGVNLLAGAIAKFHGPLYWGGGLLMIAIGLFAVSGRMWSMPSMLRSPDVTRADSATFFSLGVFSGIASSCCAPVLAGVMTLSALSGSAVGALALGLAFVFGMVIPLFVMALIWDGAGLRRRSWLRAKGFRIRLGRRTIHTNTVNLAVGVAFTAMGLGVISLAGSPDMTGGSVVQDALGRSLTAAAQSVLRALDPIPDPLLGVGLLAVAGLFIWATLRGKATDKTVRATTEQTEPHCHPEPAGSTSTRSHR